MVAGVAVRIAQPPAVVIVTSDPAELIDSELPDR
jgi:hypothetical protein